MNKISSTNRRRFLSLLAGLGLTGAFQFSLLRRGLANGHSADQLRDRLSKVYHCPESAKVIGLEYLRTTPEEAHKAVLLELICRRSASNQSRLLKSDDPTMRRVLQKWIRKDFELGRTVFVNGWMLSQTEARLCAVTALSI